METMSQEQKSWNELMQVAEMLGQIGIVGATAYVGTVASADAISRLRAFIQDKMRGLEDACNQLDNINPVDIGEMSDPTPIHAKTGAHAIYG